VSDCPTCLSAPEPDPDDEKTFYEILGRIEAGEIQGMRAGVARDIVDVTLGPQAGVSSEGTAWILLPISQSSVMKWLYAYDALLDHGCYDAYTVMLQFLSPTANSFEQLVPHLSEAARETPDPFRHVAAEHHKGET
jgi:hypothetical protein